MASNSSKNAGTDTEMHAALKDDATVPHQSDAPDAEVFDLKGHMPVSLGAKIKNMLTNKKVLAAGGVVLTVVVAVVVNNRRTTIVTEPAEDESASV